MKYFWCIIITFSILSCNSNMPEGIIPAEEMIPILEDVHLVEAVLKKEYIRDGDEESIKYYNFIYSKHNINKADFDRSIKYYSKNPEELRTIYPEVIKNLSIRDSLLKAEENSKIDTLQLWNKKDSYTFERYTSETIPISIPVEYNKTYKISAEYRIFEDSQVKKVQPTFALVAKDTSYIIPVDKILIDTAFKKIEIMKIVADTTIRKLEGDFLNTENAGIELFKHIEVKNIQISTTIIEKEKLLGLPPIK